MFTQIVDEAGLQLCGDVLPDLDGHGRVRHLPPRRGAAVDTEGGREGPFTSDVRSIEVGGGGQKQDIQGEALGVDLAFEARFLGIKACKLTGRI